MVGVVTAPPGVVGRQRHRSDQPPDPVVHRARTIEGSMAAVVLQHKQPHEQTGSRNSEEQRDGIAEPERCPHQSPDEAEGCDRDGELEGAACRTRLAIAAQKSGPLARALGFSACLVNAQVDIFLVAFVQAVEPRRARACKRFGFQLVAPGITGTLRPACNCSEVGPAIPCTRAPGRRPTTKPVESPCLCESGANGPSPLPSACRRGADS